MAGEDEIDLTEIGNDLKETDTLIADGDGVKDGAAPKDVDKGQQSEDKPQRVSIRDSIKQAITETNERQQQQEVKTKEPKVPADKQISSETKETHEQTPQDKKEETTPTVTDIKPPVSWSKEAKESWNTLPPAIQNAVFKREKEFSDGIKQYADDAKKFRELEPYFAPHRQSMATGGVNEVQVVAKLFDWFNNLSANDPNHKALAFKALASSFGVDLSRVFPQNTKAAENNREDKPANGDQQVQNIDISQHPAFQQIYRTVEQMQTQQIEAQKQSALSYVNEWSKDKVHFPKVRDTMRALLSSGAIPLKNGILDLDAAYEKAIRMDDELYKQFQEEQIAKAADEKAKELAKKEREKAQQLQNKRNAASSIRPAAPSSGLNGQHRPNKKMSVRESIKAAMAEHSGS